jgi:hypothetical protein
MSISSAIQSLRLTRKYIRQLELIYLLILRLIAHLCRFLHRLIDFGTGWDVEIGVFSETGPCEPLCAGFWWNGGDCAHVPDLHCNAVSTKLYMSVHSTYERVECGLSECVNVGSGEALRTAMPVWGNRRAPAHAALPGIILSRNQSSNY